MNIPPSLTEASDNFVSIHYCFSDFAVIFQLLAGIFLVASFLDYTNKFVDNKVDRLKGDLQNIIANLQFKISGGLPRGYESNKKLNKLHSSFFNKTAKIQSLQDNVNSNVIGDLATKFLDKYLYLGIYCLFMLFFAAFENKFLVSKLYYFNIYYSIWFIFTLLSMLFLVVDILLFLFLKYEFPIVMIPFVFVLNLILSTLIHFLCWQIDIQRIDVIVSLSLVIIILTPIIHGAFFIIIEVAEIRARKLDRSINCVLQKIVSESIKINGTSHNA